MTKNTPHIFISLLLMLLCIGILPVTAFASGGDYPDDTLPAAESSAADTQETKQIGTVTTNGGSLNVRTGAGLDNTAFTQLPNGTVVDVIGRDGDWVKILLPARAGYVYGSYLTVTDTADSTVSIGGITLPFDEKELADLWQLLLGSMTGGSDALTPDGNLTLIDDIGSSTKAGKQFITLESKNGNVFYMIIDRDDEGEETVHFLNQVDEADLMALTGEEETPATCSCTTKCVAGAVNTSCPVCAVNMTECAGKEAKPEVSTEPTEPAAEEPEKKSGVGGILVVLLIVALGGGAAFYIFKQKKAKPQTKGSADLDDYDYGEDECGITRGCVILSASSKTTSICGESPLCRMCFLLRRGAIFSERRSSWLKNKPAKTGCGRSLTASKTASRSCSRAISTGSISPP